MSLFSRTSLQYVRGEHGGRIAAASAYAALGDAYARAQLLLVLLSEARRQGATTLERVLATAREGRWLSRR